MRAMVDRASAEIAFSVMVSYVLKKFNDELAKKLSNGNGKMERRSHFGWSPIPHQARTTL
jgi:hypothetical protein